MSRLENRRSFLALAGISAAGALPGASYAAMLGKPKEVDLVVYNAKVFTMDPARPRAEAFAVRGGRFVAIGSTGELRGLISPGVQTYDAKGMVVVPGFIDTHNHATGEVLLYEVLVGNPFEVEFVTIASIIDKLKARAMQTPPGVWVSGYFFDDTKVKDGRELNIHDLDQVSRDHPVIVTHRGGHTSYYNSKAFELAGITKNTPAPFGGTLDKDANGELTGRVTDRAKALFADAGARPTYTPAQRAQRARDGLAHISKEFVRYGLTSVHHESGDLSAIQEVRARGDLLHRVSYEATGPVLEAMIANGIRTGFGDEWIRFGSTSEHTVDGSFSERTMAISVPYLGITPPYQGNITQKQDELDAWVERVHRAGIQVNCHANGDVAIDMYLTALERAQNAFPVEDARPKITHCSLINDNLLSRMKALNCVPAVFNTYAYYNSDKFRFYGEDMMKRMMAYRSFIDTGIYAAAGSDFSPGPFSPLMGVQGMVTRTGWNGETWGANQRVSVGEAIMINTFNGAYNSHEEKIKGSITPGKLADFVVLADDPHTIEPSKIKDIKIVRTVTGGNTVYQA